MDVNFSGIRSQLLLNNQLINEPGEIAGRFVRVLKQCLIYMREDARFGAATFVVCNILFMHIAMLVAMITDQILSFVFGADSQLKTNSIKAKNLVILTFAVSSLVGMNVALARVLKANMSPMATVAVSAGSCASYCLVRMWLVRK